MRENEKAEAPTNAPGLQKTQDHQQDSIPSASSQLHYWMDGVHPHKILAVWNPTGDRIAAEYVTSTNSFHPICRNKFNKATHKK